MSTYEKKKLRSLEEMFRDFELFCIPGDWPEEAIRELKKAFMAGAFSIFTSLRDDIYGLPEEVVLAYLGQLEAQFKSYIQKISS